MPHLIRQSTLAKRLGISRQTVSNHCRLGGRFHDAMVGNRVDMTHPAILEYVDERANGEVAKRTNRRPYEVPIDLRDVPLGSVGDRFRGEPELMEWLRILKLVEEIRHARLRNDEFEGQIISRDLVAEHALGAMSEVARRLLSDAAHAITQQLHQNAASGFSLEKSERDVRGLISQVLSSVFRERENRLNE